MRDFTVQRWRNHVITCKVEFEISFQQLDRSRTCILKYNFSNVSCSFILYFSLTLHPFIVSFLESKPWSECSGLASGEYRYTCYLVLEIPKTWFHDHHPIDIVTYQVGNLCGTNRCMETYLILFYAVVHCRLLCSNQNQASMLKDNSLASSCQDLAYFLEGLQLPHILAGNRVLPKLG